MIVSSLTKAIIMSILICSVCSNKTSYNPRILSLKAKHLSTYIGRGYDIYRGNPKSNIVDPGFRAQIFQFTFDLKKKTDDDMYNVPDYVTVNNAVSCHYFHSSAEYSSSSEYQESLKKLVSIEGGYKGILISASFTASSDFSQNSQAIDNDRQLIIETGAECQVYSLQLPVNDQGLILSQNFKNTLNLTYTGRSTWQSVIDKFGTHLVVEANLGGRNYYKYSMTAQDKTILKSSKIDVSAAASFSYQGLTGSASVDVKNNKKQIDKFNSVIKSIRQSIIGGSPITNGDIFGWQKTVEQSPMPISYTLFKLSDLIDQIHFPSLTNGVLMEMKNSLSNAIDNYCNLNSNVCKKPSANKIPELKLLPRFYFSSQFGGGGGSPFNDNLQTQSLFSPNMQIVRIEIRNGQYIDSLQLFLSDDTQNYLTLNKHGGNGGGLDTFNVDQGDYINQVEIWSGRYVDAIQFRTKNGQSSRKFGGRGGGYSSIYAPFTGAQLIAISGRSGGFLDAIQLVWKSTQFVTGAAGFDLPGQDINCGPSSDASPDQCKSKCQSTPQCTHYTWFYRDSQQNCCIKYGWRSYLSQVFRLDLSPIVSEIL